MKGIRERGFIICSLLLVLFSCSQAGKDKDIKQTIATKAKEEPAFASVSYTVSGGVVTLSGNVPSEKQKTEVEQEVKGTAGVKEVVNQITVGAVVLTGDHPLQQSVDSVLKKYPTVQAVVKDSIIVVQGNVDSKKAIKMLNSLQRLNAKGLANELVITSVSQDQNAAK
jgi:hypothetical protein